MKINNFKNELNSFLSSHLAKLIIEQKIETINLIKPKKINIALAFLMLPNVKLSHPHNAKQIKIQGNFDSTFSAI